MAEWLKAHAWKACVCSNVYREFESHLLRHTLTFLSKSGIIPSEMTELPRNHVFDTPAPEVPSDLLESIQNGEAVLKELSFEQRTYIARLIGRKVVQIGEQATTIVEQAATISELQNQLEQMRSELSKTQITLEQTQADLYKDPMTELLNAKGFEVKFDEWLNETESQENRRIAIIYIDIDGLKKINDHISHGAGDAAIQRVGEVLNAVTREDDIVAHLHGDEFALALPESRNYKNEENKSNNEPVAFDVERYVAALPDRIKAELRAEALSGEVLLTDELDSQLVKLLDEISFSHGGVVFDNNDLKQPLKSLLHIVDQKMYEEKRAKHTEDR